MVESKTASKRAAHSTNRARGRQMRHEPVAVEKLFWSEVRDRKLGGYKFKRQFLIGNYIVDFVCVREKLVVELDGPQHANTVEYDKARDAFLWHEGYRVMRFSNSETSDNLGIILLTVLQGLKTPSPRPSPPAGERE
ncbi:MAG: endonuclease domain-containing protein [Proteobacteria bacterium]|nr:endonuclease domain-containing protein [Pseudomonadota bacterium]